MLLFQLPMTDWAGEQRECGGGHDHGRHRSILGAWLANRERRRRTGSAGERESSMLRVGLTGGLGSGKSAVALVWAEAGVPVLNSDALGRAMMQAGEPVYAAIVERFGPSVVGPDGELDRAALAREAFAGGRLAELNALVHPAVIEAQERELRRLAQEGRDRLAVVESALIFEASSGEPSLGDASPARSASEIPTATASERFPGQSTGPTAPGWRDRFDVIVLVAAPEPVRVERFVTRAGGRDATESERDRLREDARRRIAAQLPESWKRRHADYVIDNNRTLVLLRREALRLLAALRERAGRAPAGLAE